MMSDIGIQAQGVGKCYQIYQRPSDRLKQSLWRGRRRYYQEFWALRDAAFEIRRGETIGVIGANGSGKSTLLQLVSGIVRPTEGEIVINGRVAALLELGAGFNPEFTGRENIFLNGSIMGLRKAEIEARYKDIAAFADIGHFIDRPVKTYSSGMYLRLAFAVAVNISPDILLVDEALSVGDARFQQKCMARIRQFCKAGIVLFVSHDMAAISELCTRVLWIDSGQIRMDTSPKLAVERYLQYMYESEPTGRIAAGIPGESESPCVERVLSCRDGEQHLEGFQPIAEEARQFGDRRMTIESGRFQSPEGLNSVVYGGQHGLLSMIIRADQDIPKPLTGFIIKDRLGREIFGERHSLAPLTAGKRYHVCFQVKTWPHLVEGDYSVTLGAANGTVDDHCQCHFIHDALIIRSIPMRPPPSGVFLLPDIGFEVTEIA